MSKSSPAWHLQAVNLRQAGLSPEAIAQQLGRSPSSVRWVLNENGERDKHREKLRRLRQRLRESAKAEREAEAAAAAKPTRSPRAKVDTMAVARLFAAGKIDRFEMSRRLRGEIAEVSA